MWLFDPGAKRVITASKAEVLSLLAQNQDVWTTFSAHGKPTRWGAPVRGVPESAPRYLRSVPGDDPTDDLGSIDEF